ncbi:hypothetical protein [Photobacterium indicum]|uniref:hypothetical protein n=1 Tax=Photobacterium indicum TaxID=81447 RepID=UPI003D0D0F3A
MGINEFFETILGQKLSNQYSWGCFVPARRSMCLTIWKEEIHRGRVEVHSEVPYRNKAGHINHNWTSRKKDLEMVKGGVATFGVLISCGKMIDEDAWNIMDLNSNQIFQLSDLQYDEATKKWTMAVDLCNPTPVEAVRFNKDVSEKILEEYTEAYRTVGRATNLGWEFIGLNSDVATLTHGTKIMTVKLSDGSYSR